jgi:hypothetical protein
MRPRQDGKANSQGGMTMTKKHFVALAKALRDNHANRELVEAVANVCKNANGNFDRGRFMAAAYDPARTVFNSTVFNSEGRAVKVIVPEMEAA